MTITRNTATKSPDTIYSDPVLVALYDHLNSAAHDHAFYRRELPVGAVDLIDLGCGTGKFAIDTARTGVHVTAIDPAPAMIDFARKRVGGETVDWIVGTAMQIPVGRSADAVLMMGHAFQCLLTEPDIRDTMSAARSAVRRGGRFLFESRNPATAPWKAWNVTETILADALSVPVTIDRKVLDVRNGFVTFSETFTLPDRVLSSRSTLRFLDKERIVNLLREAGFTDIAVFGSWDRRPFSETSAEMIFSAA